MNRLFLLIAVIIAQAIPITAESREKDLDRWVDRDMIPHVRQQLLVHPRFKGETVMFVVLKDNAPTPVSNELAISLRDRMLDAAINTPGVAVGWQQGRDSTRGTTDVDCTRDQVHYYIGLELTQELDSSYSVTIRALDLEDRSWVAGFGKTWHGQLRTIHRQAMRQTRIDNTFKGSREVPFTLAETDLLAAQLAHNLSCALSRNAGGEYVVEQTRNPADALAAAVELVGNNLASQSAVELTTDPKRRNAVLQGRAHQIDGSLYQYWLTVTPTDDGATVDTLSTSAYIVVNEASWQPEAVLADNGPALQPALSMSPADAKNLASISIPNAGNTALLGPLRISAPRSYDCGARLDSANACSVLQAEPQADAIVFFLAHQANHGLVRLGDTACRERTAARIASAGQALRFAIPQTVSGEHSAETLDWLISPRVDTYYAVAMSDARAARQVANLIDRLPIKCGDAIRPGLDGPALQAWLNEFAMLAARSSDVFDWRALQVSEIL